MRAYFNRHPAQSIVVVYLLYALLGAILLLLPFCHLINISFLDNFFMAISAISTTGLCTVDIASSYTFWGELFILLLVQIGGIGYMTFSSFIILATSQRLPAYEKKVFFGAFAFPKDFSIKEFVFNVVIFSFIAEVIGSILLAALFKEKGVDNYIWSGIFHSISAFCTAGLSLFENGIMTFQNDFWIRFVLCILMTLGGIGFIVILDLYKKIKEKDHHLTFTTKVILLMTLCFFVLGTFVFFILETHPKDLSIWEQIFSSFFQVVAACTTTGFSTFNIAYLTHASIVLLIFFMLFGASPSGTGGGIKNTTFAALTGLVKSTLSGKERVSFRNNEIPLRRVQLATAIFSFYMFILTVGTFLLTYLEDKDFLSIVFEIISALGTAGLGMGITPNLTDLGKIVVIILMFIGRTGILTFGFAVLSQRKNHDTPLERKELVF